MPPHDTSDDEFGDSEMEERIVACILDEYDTKVRCSQDRTRTAVDAAFAEAERAVLEHWARMSKLRKQWKAHFPKWVGLLESTGLGSFMDQEPLPGDMCWDPPGKPESVDSGITTIHDQDHEPARDGDYVAETESHAAQEGNGPEPPVSPPMSENLTATEPLRQANQVYIYTMSFLSFNSVYEELT